MWCVALSLEQAGLPYDVVSIPQLTDGELNQVVDAFPKLRRAATNAVLRKLFLNPYLLDKAARMQWPEDQPLPDNVRKDMRKRVLQVIVKIPKADSGGFLELVDRACTPDRDDPTGGDLVELLLEGLNGVFACRDFPDAMIRLAENRYYLSEDELETRERFDHPLALEPIFGIRHNLHIDFYPPSAIRGPFLPLLQSHPEKGSISSCA